MKGGSFGLDGNKSTALRSGYSSTVGNFIAFVLHSHASPEKYSIKRTPDGLSAPK